MEQQIKERKKKLTIDLWIIALVTIAVYIVYGVFGSRIMSFCKNSDISVWPRLLTAVALEFGIAGLGITIVGLMRKESFASFGLRWENAIKAVLWTIVFFLPYILFIFLSGQFEGYEPLSIMVTPDLHKAGIVATIIGTLVIAVVWGFFEGFNYVVICEKINRRFPVKTKFFDWGALVASIMGILFHPMSFSIQGIIEIVTTFIAIYGMLQVRKVYKNAWGCVFAFLFIWNAL
ncbi:hypothetical protein [uncultured Ruminococcus sp.]|uniref:hypothetical protein n=1 Tax=uncultured Ruminococcus sp. TaxID=165186 RepID=UPI00266D071D|nr:hypothetical protein [uncultured Ruminococcus sp.]